MIKSKIKIVKVKTKINIIKTESYMNLIQKLKQNFRKKIILYIIHRHIMNPPNLKISLYQKI